jgi:hypothetical protein
MFRILLDATHLYNPEENFECIEEFSYVGQHLEEALCSVSTILRMLYPAYKITVIIESCD